MTDFGAKLRQAREARGFSLRELADATKISAAALGALERNDISKLPGGIFSRSFVRAYAVEVGLDPDETVREFLDRFQGEPPPDRAPTVQIPDEEIAFEASKQRAAKVFLVTIALLLVAAAFLVYYLLRNRPVTETPAEVSGARMVTPPGMDQRIPSSGVSPAAAAIPGSMRLELHPTRACWVSVDVDGTKVVGRMMQAGERETLTVRENAVITVGDAGAFAFSIDGRTGHPLGGAGDVKTARINRANLSEYLR